MLAFIETAMTRLRIREIAEAKGINMSQLSRDSRQTITLIRRYWYNTADGKEDGPPLAEIRLDALDAIAATLGVKAGDLLLSK